MATDTLARVMALLRVDSLGLAAQAPPLPLEIPNVGRYRLATLFAELTFTVGAEIGVEQGVYAEALLAANPGLHLFAVDAWTAYRGYRTHVGQEKLDAFFAMTQARLAPYRVTYLRKFSVEAAKDIADESLDFVFIDGNHDFQHVAEDLSAWVPKVKRGGIISGHDYVRRNNPRDGVHVVEVVTAYTQAMRIWPYFILGSKAIVDGEARDRPRSFFWVNA